MRETETRQAWTGRELTNEWPLGSTYTSQVLPAGRFELVGRLPDGREAREKIEIRAAEATDVTLWF